MNAPRHFDRVMAVLLAAVALAAGYAVVTFGVCGVYHDDGVYVSTAKALAEGRGYRLINLPAAPLQTRYPILYAAMLAVIWRAWPAFPQNLFAMQTLSLLLGAATIALGYLYAVRVQHCRPVVAALGLALCATAPTFAYFSTQTLSEIPFALSLIAVLWIIASEQDRPSSGTREILVGLAIAIPFLLRLVGLTIVLPALWALWHRNRRILAYAVGAFAPVMAWLVWVWIARHDTAAIRAAMNNPDSWDWLARLSARDLWHTVRYNTLMLTVASADLLPASWKAHLAIAFPAIGLVTWVAVGLRGRCALLPILLPYVVLMLVWPWPTARFVVPLWPLLGPFFVAAIRRGVGHTLTLVVAMLAIAGNVVALYDMYERNRAMHVPLLTSEKSAPSWSAYERMFGWIRAHTDREEVLLSGLDPMLFLYTGRPAMRAFDVQPLPLFYGAGGDPVGTLPNFVALLTRRGGQLLVQTPMPGFAEEQPFNDLVKQLQREYPACLSPVYRDEQDVRFVIFAIDTDGCQSPQSSERSNGRRETRSSSWTPLPIADAARGYPPVPPGIN